MASYEEYAKKYLPQTEGDDLEKETKEAQAQEEVRQTSTPEIDWEKRYKDLERLNSQQAQDLGQYRKLVDEYISSDPTPAEKPAAPEPITSDDLWDNPDETVRRAVDSHPALQEVKELKEAQKKAELEANFKQFATKHSDFQEISGNPEFRDWVLSNPTHLDLAQRADAMDLTAADALFSLYKAQRGLEQVSAEREQQTNIDNATLESPHGSEPPAPQRYSRSEMLRQKIRAKQGDLEAEMYVNAHAEAYRNALAEGNVRD